MQLSLSNEKKLLEYIKDEYGTKEEFFAELIEDFPNLLDGKVTEALIEGIANSTGLTLRTVTRFFRSTIFHDLIDRHSALDTYGAQQRLETVKGLVSIAINPTKTILSKRGEAVKIDRDAKEIVIADEHLRALQGRPVDSKDGKVNSSGVNIQINFGNGQEDDRTFGALPTITIPHYVPNQPGGLPPTGARPHYEPGKSQEHNPLAIPREYDFSGSLVGGKEIDNRRNLTKGLFPAGKEAGKL